MSVASLVEVKKLPILAFILVNIKIRFQIQFSVTLKKVTNKQIMILITNVVFSANFTLRSFNGKSSHRPVSTLEPMVTSPIFDNFGIIKF